VGEPFPIDSVGGHDKLDLGFSGRRCLGGVGPLSCEKNIAALPPPSQAITQNFFRVFSRGLLDKSIQGYTLRRRGCDKLLQLTRVPLSPWKAESRVELSAFAGVGGAPSSPGFFTYLFISLELSAAAAGRRLRPPTSRELLNYSR
jgi:hypothetical protein